MLRAGPFSRSSARRAQEIRLKRRGSQGRLNRKQAGYCLCFPSPKRVCNPLYKFYSNILTMSTEEEEEEEDESFMYEPSVWDKARWKLVDWRRQSTPSRGRICCCCSGFCCILTIVLIVLILLASAAITFAMNNKWIFAL